MSISALTIDSCDFRSRKFTTLLSEPLGEKMLYALPGIGVNTLRRIQETKQISKAKDLLDEFIYRFRSDNEQFRWWLMNDYALPEYRATACVMALMDYIDRAKKYDWPLS